MKTFLCALLLFLPAFSRADGDPPKRRERHVSLSVMPIGLGPYGTAHLVTAGVFLGADSVIQYEAGSAATFFTGDTTEHFEVSYQGIFLKHFISDSFFVKGGIASNDIKNFRNHDVSGAIGLRRYAGKTVDAIFAVGNELHGGPMVVGIDWVRFARKLSEEVTVNDGGLQTPGESSFAFAYFYLGLSF